MNIIESFANYMEDLGLGTIGTDIFIGGAPVESTVDPIWWILSGGGTSNPKNNTGERIKNYIIDIYYRSMNAQDVYDKLQELEESVNADSCIQIAGYETIDMEAISFPADQDIDDEERTVGLLQVTVSVYQS